MSQSESKKFATIPNISSSKSDGAANAYSRIKPSKGWVSVDVRQIWYFRELLYFLIWRDIKIRYKQTVLGAAWAIIQPMFAMIVFSLFFGRLAKVPSDGIPYPLFCLAALVPWNFFSNGLSQGSNSLVANSNLITKVYFPRLIIPIATVVSGVVDFALALILLFSMLVYYGSRPSFNALFVPFFLLLAFATSLGVSLWLSALNVKYRDVRYILTFVIQMWMFATPIAYPSSLLGGGWRTIYGLNPMVGVVEGFRWGLLGTERQPWTVTAISSISSIIILVTGAFYFRRMEKTFADTV